MFDARFTLHPGTDKLNWLPVRDHRFSRLCPVSKVVVIGAGVAGLAAAIRLADFGHDVTIVERAPVAGGQLRPLDRHDSSPLITLPAVLRDLFRKTGRPLERCLDLTPAGQAQRFIFSDGTTVDLPNASRAGTLAALDDHLAPGAGAEWDAVIRHGGAVWEELRAYLTRPIRMRDAWKLRTSRLFRGTLGDVATRHLTDRRLGAMLGSYATSIGSELRIAPAAVAALPYIEHAFGMWRVNGGASALINAMVARANEKGAKVRFATPASQLKLHDNKLAAGVTTTDGETIAADVVVSTIAPDLLIPHGIGTRPPGPSVLSVAALLTAEVPPIPERTIITSDDDTPDITVEAQPGSRQVVLHLPVDPESPADTERQVEHVLWTATHRGLHVGPAAPTVRSPHDLEDVSGAPNGSVYGAAWLRTGKVSSNTVRGVHGLYVAGAVTHPGPTIPFAVMSADIVTDLIGRA